jgi:phosphate starvation-inducible PhoH-like protein
MPKKTNPNRFHIEFRSGEQKLAWAGFQQHDVLFLMGPAGVGKSHLAMAFAINEVLQNNRGKIVVSRPIVESGESLGYLPGDFHEKVNPYMLPLYDSIDKLVGKTGPQKDAVMAALEVAPIGYMRGRAESLESILPTPEGCKRMGEIKVGDLVFGSNGRPVKVLGVYPQGKKPIYKVIFSDNTWVKCSEDHLWNTMTLNEKKHNKGYSTKTTKEIAETIKNKWNQKVHRVPIVSNFVKFHSKEVFVDPYVLGVLLGDGHIRVGQIGLTTADSFVRNEVEKRIPHGMKLIHRKGYDYRIIVSDKKNIKRFNPLLSELSKIGLVGKLSHNKFVPEQYKYNSENVRLEVLQGLLDTDGWVGKHHSGNSRIQYYTTSKQLASDVMYLTRSLGGMAYCRKRDFDEHDEHEYKGKIIRHTKSCYVVDIIMPKLNPFKLPRKANKFSPQRPVKLVKSVEYIGEEECQCIRVDANDFLYLTNDFIVTHNTFDNAVCIFDEAQNATFMQLKLFLTRFGENSKIIVTGDPSQSDIGHASGLVEVVSKVSSLKGIAVIEFTRNSVVRHPLVADILEKLAN